jgi:hypothetical protein
MQALDPINNHQLYREGPFLVFENHGDFSLAEAKRATAVYSQVIREEGRLYLLLDITDSHQVSSETRRHLVEWGKVHSAQTAIAAVGGNVAFRTTFTLIINAIRLLSAQPLRMAFCRDRDDANAWLRAQPLRSARHLEIR